MYRGDRVSHFMGVEVEREDDSLCTMWMLMNESGCCWQLQRDRVERFQKLARFFMTVANN